MLTGKLFCGHCGSSMCGESGTSHTGTIYNYYKCSDRKKRGNCTKANEKKDFIEQLVVRKTIEKIMQPGVIQEIAYKVAELAEKAFNDKSRLLSLQSELKAVQTAIRNLLRLVEQGIDTDDVGDRLLDLNSQKADLQKQIAKEENKKPLISAERLAFWLTDLLTNGDKDDPAYQQRIIDTLVNKVFVFDTDDGGKKIVITYNTSRSLKSTITLSDVKSYLESSDIKGYARPNKTLTFRSVSCFLGRMTGLRLRRSPERSEGRRVAFASAAGGGYSER